jgi:hypothetical protein
MTHTDKDPAQLRAEIAEREAAPVVSQADRLRALNTHLIINPHIPQRWRTQMLDGGMDADRIVLAFARHRHQSTAPLIEALEQAREALKKIDRMNDHPGWFRRELDQIVMPALAAIAAATPPSAV